MKNYHRPKTRGDIVASILTGVDCEVAATNEEITSQFLEGWFNLSEMFTTRPSENKGWVIYSLKK